MKNGITPFCIGGSRDWKSVGWLISRLNPAYTLILEVHLRIGLLDPCFRRG